MSGRTLAKGRRAAYEPARTAYQRQYPDRPLVPGVYEVNDQGAGWYYVRLLRDDGPRPTASHWQVDFIGDEPAVRRGVPAARVQRLFGRCGLRAGDKGAGRRRVKLLAGRPGWGSKKLGRSQKTFRAIS